jgi:hypothetical protein
LAVPTRLFVVLIQKATADGGNALIAGAVAFGLFMLVVSPIVSAAITHAISEAYLGRAVSYGDSLSVGLKLLIPLTGTAFLMFLILIPAFLLLVIPGLYLAFAYMLVNQVIVIEGSTGWSALKRSHELTKQHMLRVVAVSVVSYAIMSLLSIALQLVSNQILPYAGFILDSLVQAVTTTYVAAALIVLYFDIRCRKEAFDLVHLAQRLGGAEPQKATTI